MEAGFRRIAAVLFYGGVALLFVTLWWLNNWQFDQPGNGQIVATVRIIAAWWAATYGLFYVGRWIARGFKKGAR